MNKNNYALIMAGGVGSRFWPVSRTEYPKQFIDFFGVGKTLIQSTYERFLRICPAENIFIVTNEIYTDIIKHQLPDVSDNQILAEPIMRNTAPCISYGSSKIAQLNPDATIVVAPSDHTITNQEAFIEAIEQSLKAASENDCLITLGIKPSRPDTGYGYIQYTENSLPTDSQIHKVKIFTEKPNLELAKSFIQSGDFLWNAGIFIWSAKAINQSFATHLPEMHEIFQQGSSVYNTDGEIEFIGSAYQQCTNISIDFGIMEKAV
ncbi:MAG: mannose-1-phosphate guanylyltransferase, partial [Sphingobacteriales bacterium]